VIHFKCFSVILNYIILRQPCQYTFCIWYYLLYTTGTICLFFRQCCTILVHV